MDHVYEDYNDLHIRTTIVYLGSRSSDSATCAFFDLNKSRPCSTTNLRDLYCKGVVFYDFDLLSGEDCYYRPLCNVEGVLYFLKNSSNNKAVLSDVRGWEVPV